MARLRTCPQGHQWRADDAAGLPPTDYGVPGDVVCPVCGARALPAVADVTESERLLLSPTTFPPGKVPADAPTLTRPQGPSAARSQPTPRSEWPTIPGYEMLEELGQGGMGVVYKAFQLGLDRLVALKMIRGGLTVDADVLARFRAEAE